MNIGREKNWDTLKGMLSKFFYGIIWEFSQHFGRKNRSLRNLGSGGSPIPKSKCKNIGKILTFW